MKKVNYLIVAVIFSLFAPFIFMNSVQAANQFGYPEAIYNGSTGRWEADLSQSSQYEGPENMMFQNSLYWSNDPVSKNMIYNSRSFNPGVGGYNYVSISYPSDNGSWRSIYLLYVGPVKVQYLEIGTDNTLSPLVYLSGGGGEAYTTQSQQIAGYQLDHIVGNESGTFQFLGANYGTTGNPNVSSSVVYYYKKTIEGKVTVKYVDESGKEISDSEILTGNVGESYTSTQKEITGYSFKEVQGNPTGKISEDDQTVTYVYTKDSVAGGKVTVKYVDESGKEISDSEILTGNVGESYTSTQKEIAGYSFKEVQGNPTGEISENEQTVTYVYTKDSVAGGKITVKYVDESGKEISDSEILTGNVGESYTSTQKEIAGYSFKEVQGNPAGKISENEQTVTYVYTKGSVAGGKITVKYVDESRKVVNKEKTPKQHQKKYLSNKEVLPNTGEDNILSTYMIFIGVVLVMGLTIVSVTKFRKKV
ncbi:MucBP domain-containing protein [Enterococcus faecalis]